MIVSSNEFLAQLEFEFGGLKTPRYKFREFFETEKRVFFDARDHDRAGTLEQLLDRQNLRSFVAFLLTRGSDGSPKILDISFANLVTETLRKFMNRYGSQLEPSAKMSLAASGLEYLRLVGFSYRE